MSKVKPQDDTPVSAFALADRLHSAAIHLLRRVRPQDAALKIGPARLSALSVLVFGGPQSLGSLAFAEQVRPPTMSRIVSGLARDGLIEVRPDSGDARRMCIRATPKGKRLLLKGRQLRVEKLAAQLESLGAGDLAKLEDAIGSLQSMLQNWN